MGADILLQAAALGLMKVVNFAHGEFITLGLYLTLTSSMLGLGPYAAAPFVVAVVFILAAGFFRMAILPSLDHPQINQMLIMIGISFMLIGAVQIIWGPNNCVVPLSWARDAVELCPLRITYSRGLAFLTALGVAGLFWWALNHTRFGIAVRAASQEPASARICGIDVRRVQMITFGAGASLAALAGVLMAPIFPMNPTIGV
ncbi:MAG: branched-chain amino acid ABC transporter permease, partial [Pseudomonadota bacterium]